MSKKKPPWYVIPERPVESVYNVVPIEGDGPWKSWTNRYLGGTIKQARRMSRHGKEFL